MARRNWRWEEAAGHYDTLAELERGRGAPLYVGSRLEILLGRGQGRREMSDWHGAIRDFHAAWTLWKDYPEPGLLLAETYYLAGEPLEAERIAVELHTRSRSSQEAAAQIAGLYASFGDVDRTSKWSAHVHDEYVRIRLRGEALLRSFLARRDSDPDDRTKLEQLDELEHIARRTLTLEPESARALLFCSRVRFAAGDFRGADELCQRAAALLGEDRRPPPAQLEAQRVDTEGVFVRAQPLDSPINADVAVQPARVRLSERGRAGVTAYGYIAGIRTGGSQDIAIRFFDGFSFPVERVASMPIVEALGEEFMPKADYDIQLDVRQGSVALRVQRVGGPEPVVLEANHSRRSNNRGGLHFGISSSVARGEGRESASTTAGGDDVLLLLLKGMS